MKGSEGYVYCLSCKEVIIPLNMDIGNVAHSISPSNSLKALFNNINEFNGNKNENLENDIPILNCNYVDIESFKHTNNKKTFFMFHLNIASLNQNIKMNWKQF